jgi:hypothetical protein
VIFTFSQPFLFLLNIRGLSMARLIIILFLMAFSSLAHAAQYQVTYGWTDSTTYLPTDEPRYNAQYRVNGGTPVVIPETTTPSGNFNLSANSADSIEMCVQNKNGNLISPADCTGNWFAVGNAPPPPLTQPGQPTGFSATIIYLGQ